MMCDECADNQDKLMREAAEEFKSRPKGQSAVDYFFQRTKEPKMVDVVDRHARRAARAELRKIAKGLCNPKWNAASKAVRTTQDAVHLIRQRGLAGEHAEVLKAAGYKI